MAKTDVAEGQEAKKAKVIRRKPVIDIPKVVPFFQRVASIAKEDWGKRATLKLYRLEPVINRLATSDNKYINIYAEPIDEERIKQDFGSGKYRLYLNYKLPNSAEGTELDSMEFDIMDMNYPPRIPFGEWVDAPKNKDWAWAKEKLQPPAVAPVVAQSAAAGLVDTLRAVNEIQDSAVERSRANAPAPIDPLAMFKGFMDLMPKPQPASENGMFTAVVTMMTGMMQQQGQIMQAQIQAANTREESLRTQMMAIQKPGSGLTTIKELLTEADPILEKLKTFFPAVESRPRNMPWWAGLLEKVAEGASPAIPMIVGQIMANANQKRAEQPPHQNGAPRPTSAPQVAAPQESPAPTTIGPQIDLDGPLLSMLDAGRNGEDLADFLNSAYGPDGVRLYDGLCQMGDAGLIQLIQSRPIWDKLGHHQAKIPEFIKQFIAYGKEGDDGSQLNDLGAAITPEVL